jgi:hypothetical protein
MISRAYGQRRETARFVWRKIAFAFADFSASSWPKRQDREINGGFRARAALEARRGCSNGSEMAPQSFEITRNGLGNGEPPACGSA